MIERDHKGKVKIEPKPAVAADAGSAVATVAVQQVVVTGAAKVEPAAAPAPAPTERAMTTEEQVAEARKGIEGLAAFWQQPNLEEMLMKAAQVLDHPTVKPPADFELRMRRVC